MPDKELVVFNNIKDWFPPVVIDKEMLGILTVPRISIDLRIPYPEGVLDKGQAIIKVEFKKKFHDKFTSISEKTFSSVQSQLNEFQKLIKNIKKNLEKIGFSKDQIQEELNKGLLEVNKTLTACNDQWVKAVEKLAAEAFDAALAVSDKQMRAKIKRAKARVYIKAAVTAVFGFTVVGLGLVATLAAVAVSVVSGGTSLALTIPTAIAGLLTTVASTVATVRALVADLKGGADLCETTCKQVQTDLDALNKYFENANLSLSEGGGTRRWDRHKAGWSPLMKHVGELEKFHRDLVIRANGLMKNYDTQLITIRGISFKISRGEKDKKKIDEIKKLQARRDVLEKQMAFVRKKIGESVNGLEKLHGLEEEAAELEALIDAAVAKGRVPDVRRFAGRLDDMMEVVKTILPVFDMTAKVATGVKDLVSACGIK